MPLSLLTLNFWGSRKLGQIIELAHKIVVYNEIPPLYDWLYSTAFVLAFLFTGYALFRKYEKKIPEEL